MIVSSLYLPMFLIPSDHLFIIGFGIVFYVILFVMEKMYEKKILLKMNLV